VTLDNQRVHLVAVPHGFQFLMFFCNPDVGPLATLRVNAECTLTPVDIAEQLRAVADKVEKGNVIRRDISG
jgi:hypothetical protein